MKSFLAKVWAFYGRNTFVRHAVTAVAAVLIVENADWLTAWAVEMFDTATVKTLAMGAIGAAVRWAQTRLELLIAASLQPSRP